MDVTTGGAKRGRKTSRQDAHTHQCFYDSRIQKRFVLILKERQSDVQSPIHNDSVCTYILMLPEHKHKQYEKHVNYRNRRWKFPKMR